MIEKFNIGMVLDGGYPSDIRVRKEAESLAKEFEVYVFCVKKKHEATYETINNVRIVRGVSYKNNSHKGFIDTLLSMGFKHPLFSKGLPNFIINNNINVLHVHDLPLAKTVHKIATIFSLKTTIDLHENYPEALISWFIWRKNILIRLKNRLFFNYKLWSNYEKNILPKYDLIIAVVDEMKNRIINKYGIEPSKILVVTNTEKRTFITKYRLDKTNILTPYKDRFTIVYIGGIGPHRGIQTAIKAIKHIRKKIPNVILIVIGTAHKDVLYYLNQLVYKNHAVNYVKFFENQPFDSVPNIMQTADINIIPHEKNNHTDNTIPHKFFQILMSERPLLVSDCKPLERIVKKDDIGWIFKAGDPISFSKRVFEISENKLISHKKSIRGKEICVNGNLNWENTALELINYYKLLKK